MALPFFLSNILYFQASRFMHNTLLCIEYWQNILFTSENRFVCARHAPNILDMHKWRQLTKRTVLFSTKPQQALLGSLKTHLYMKGHRLSNKKKNSEEPLRAPKIFTYGTKSWLFKSPVKVSTYIPLMRISYGQDSEKGLWEHNNYSCMLNSPSPIHLHHKCSVSFRMHSLFLSSRSMQQYSQILFFPHKLYVSPMKKKKGEKWGYIHKQCSSLKRNHPVWLFRGLS